MDPIAGTNQNQAAAAAAAAAKAGAGATDGSDTAAGTEDRFLKLLVAQMRNQDPLNPLDNAQVTSQLAQINTVRGIEQLNGSMAAMAAASTSVSPVSAVGLLGRQVLIAGEDFQWAADAPEIVNPDPSLPALPTATDRVVRLGFDLSAPAKAVRVEIVDAAGQLVHAQDLSDVEAGVQSFSWDGMRTEGGAASAGKYRLRVYAAGYDDAELKVDPLVSARVSGVAQAPGGTRIELGDRAARAASAIRAVL